MAGQHPHLSNVPGLANLIRLTPEVKETILGHIRKGTHISVACEAAGISYGTYKKWIQRAERTDRSDPNEQAPIALIEFVEEVRRAEAELESEIVNSVKGAAMNDGELGLKYLSRRFPARWREQRESIQHNVNWLIRAVDMVRKGETTLEILDDTLGPELTNEVRKQLGGDVVEGDVTELPTLVESIPAESDNATS